MAALKHFYRDLSDPLWNVYGPLDRLGFKLDHKSP